MVVGFCNVKFISKIDARTTVSTFLEKEPDCKQIRLGTIHILHQQRTWWVGLENCQFCVQYCIYADLTLQVGAWVRESPKLF